MQNETIIQEHGIGCTGARLARGEKSVLGHGGVER